MTALLGPSPLQLPGLLARKPWQDVARAQGWLDEMTDVPSTVLVDLWPALRRNGVPDFEVAEDELAVVVLNRALGHLRASAEDPFFNVLVDHTGQAYVEAGIDVSGEVSEGFYWVDLAAVEALEWTDPDAYLVALRGCAVLSEVCGICLAHEGEAEWYVQTCADAEDAGDEGPEGWGLGEWGAAVYQHVERAYDHFSALFKTPGLGDIEALLEAARQLGPERSSWLVWAESLAAAARAVGDIYAMAGDETTGEEPFQDMFRLVHAPRHFIEYLEAGDNDRFGSVGVARPCKTIRLSPRGRDGSLARLLGGVDAVRRGLGLLCRVIENLNGLTGAWEGAPGEEEA